MHIVAFWLAAIFVATSAPAPKCAFHHRQRVQVRAPADSPRPFLWSSIQSLAERQDGRGTDFFVYLHTQLLQNGDVAIVTAACPQNHRRIIGVHILSGLHADADGYVDVMDAEYPPK